MSTLPRPLMVFFTVGLISSAVGQLIMAPPRDGLLLWSIVAATVAGLIDLWFFKR